MLTWKTFIIALTALLPLINPIGSALIFLGLVGDQPPDVYKRLARRIAISTLGFLVFVEFSGSILLRFFGISLPIVQVAGGVVIAATAWALLFESDASSHARSKEEEIAGCASSSDENFAAKIFYPYTFPITAGPGTMVIMLTLSAHASDNSLLGKAAAHGGIALASIVLSISVYFCYAYAPKLLATVSPSTVHGVLRVIAFILMCVGVQIAWNGLAQLGSSFQMQKL